jgi:hypothetical protein
LTSSLLSCQNIIFNGIDQAALYVKARYQE